MPTEKKKQAIDELATKFSASTATVVTEYRGLSVKALKELRTALGPDAEYTVAKNTLVRRAAEKAGVKGLDDLFIGPTALAFLNGEPVDAAKALKKFAKDNKSLVIKGGYMEGAPLSVSQIEAISELESKEVILSKIAGALKGNLAKAAGLFAAPATQAARLIAALEEKQKAA